jgi:hypothetical protein
LASFLVCSTGISHENRFSWLVVTVGHRGLYEITQTRHPGVLLAGVQQFKEMDSGQKPAGMTMDKWYQAGSLPE